MRAAVVLFPGSNADAEMVHALRNIVGIPTEISWHKQSELPAQTDLVAIPGGFAYGDYLRAGAIAKASAIVGAIRRHAERGGLVLGVCNGFQVLTEIGLLPGALTRNQNLRFECREIYIRVEAEGPFTSGYSGVLRVPIAHGEGRYQADARTLTELSERQRVAFRYSDGEGQLTPETNINGSVSAIAGVYGGPQHNVLGLMPHPERASEPLVGSADGRKLFESVVRYHAARQRPA
jgi:phosphoribosylformylglycinamidine synthase I